MEQRKKKSLPMVTIILGVITCFMFMSKNSTFNGMAIITGLVTIICTLIELLSLKKYEKSHVFFSALICVMIFGTFINCMERDTSTNVVLVPQEEKKSYIITFDADGGSKIDPITVNSDTFLSLPKPKKDGYEFKNWTLDGKEFKMVGYVGSRITSDVTLKATYEKAKTTNTTNSSSVSSSKNSTTSNAKTNSSTSSKTIKTESKSNYISSCNNYNSKYDDIVRNPNSYKGKRMKFRGMVEDRWKQGGEISAFTLSACTNDNRHIGMLYCTVDKSVLNGANLSQYDYLNVYGEFKGLTEDLYSVGYFSSGYVDYPHLAIKYIEFTSY